MADNILSDFGINLLEEEVDDVIFRPTSFCVTRHSRDRKARSGGYCRCAWHWRHFSQLSWRQAWRTR